MLQYYPYVIMGIIGDAKKIGIPIEIYGVN